MKTMNVNVVAAAVAVLVAATACAPSQPANADNGVNGLEMRCSDGSRIACTRLIDIYENGEGVPRNPERAARLRRYVDSLARSQTAQQKSSASMPSSQAQQQQTTAPTPVSRTVELACQHKCQAGRADCLHRLEQRERAQQAADEAGVATCESEFSSCKVRCVTGGDPSLEAQARHCKEGNGRACHVMAQHDAVDALFWNDKACEHGYQPACAPGQDAHRQGCRAKCASESSACLDKSQKIPKPDPCPNRCRGRSDYGTCLIDCANAISPPPWRCLDAQKQCLARCR